MFEIKIGKSRPFSGRARRIESRIALLPCDYFIIRGIKNKFPVAPDAGGFDSAFHIRNPGAVAGIAEFVDETGPGASYAFKTALILFQFSYVEFRLLLKRESEKNFRAFAV